MSGFFSDNQAKQKAFDRYYNAMARSDFKQSRALKSLIQQQYMDEAQTDSLANLFQQAMFKGREYEYDDITNKLMKKKPPVVGPVAGKPSKAPKVKVNIGKGSNGRFTKKAASATPDSDEDMGQAAPKTPSPKKTKYKAATPQKKRSPAKNFESEDLEMKSAIPMTPPRRNSDSLFPPSSYQTPPRRKSDGHFSVRPNIASPATRTRIQARVAMEDELDAPPPTPPSKFFDDLFGTNGSTANDIATASETASEKIDANNDSDSLRKLLERLSKERAASKFAKPGKKNKVSSSPISKNQMMAKIAKALNAKPYLSAKEKSAAAKKMEAIVEEVSNSPPSKMKTAIDILTSPKRVGKRARQVTPPGYIRTDDRGGKYYKQGPQSPNIKRNIYDALDDADSESYDEEIKQEIEESKYNQKRLNELEFLVNKKTKPLALHKELKAQYGKEINKIIAQRDGISLSGKSGEAYKYFLKEFPQPKKDQAIASYRKEVAGLVRGIYLVRS